MDEGLSALRSMAHPVRLRILSMLTATPMSAAEVARELDLTHANASYHLRVLHDAGELVVESEEKIRGGTAKRYRYPVDRPIRSSGRPIEHRMADARATAVEIERRLVEHAPGPGIYSDLETWVPVETWHRVIELLHEASRLLHEAAQPARSPATVHVSATSQAFTMQGGLGGDDVRRPS